MVGLGFNSSCVLILKELSEQVKFLKMERDVKNGAVRMHGTGMPKLHEGIPNILLTPTDRIHIIIHLV